MKKSGVLSSGKKLVIGAGMAALSAATFYFFGPKGKTHRKHLKTWTIKMKADILEKIEEAGDVTESAYRKIVDEVATLYTKAGKVSKEEIAVYANTLKKQWKSIVKTVKPAQKKAKKSVKKVAKKAVKKAVKKTTKRK